VIDIALLGLGAALGLTTIVWLYSLTQKDASVIDIFWGPGFALLA
jgi:steroid 5-alpha reductase family enzyme